MLRRLLLAFSALALVACKHPLVIQGEGDIVERLLGERGCTLEEFQAGAARCADNDIVDESYTVQFEAVPRPGWQFVGWEGAGCKPDSATPYCEYDVSAALVVLTEATWPGIELPATIAVFEPIPAGYTFTKIVDNNDAIPGRDGNFDSFGLPALDGNDLAFDTVNFADKYRAIFVFSGAALNLVADTNTLIPGGMGTFERVFSPEISQGNVVFGGLRFGSGSTADQWGIYTDLGGSVRAVADTHTPIPWRSGNFDTDLAIEDSFRISDGVVAFDTYSGTGVYAEFNGALDIIADQSDGGGGLDELFLLGIDEDTVVYHGIFYGQAGVYSHTRVGSGYGAVSTLFTTDIDQTGYFFDFASDTHSLIELKDDFSQIGLYLNVRGNRHLVAKIGDLTPDGVGNFTYFDKLAVSGDQLAFVAGEDEVNFNIYRYLYGVLHEVISIGDTLDGKTVVHLNMKNDTGFDNGVIAFEVDFDDGSSGIYLATPD